MQPCWKTSCSCRVPPGEGWTGIAPEGWTATADGEGWMGTRTCCPLRRKVTGELLKLNNILNKSKKYEKRFKLMFCEWDNFQLFRRLLNLNWMKGLELNFTFNWKTLRIL